MFDTVSQTLSESFQIVLKIICWSKMKSLFLPYNRYPQYDTYLPESVRLLFSNGSTGWNLWVKRLNRIFIFLNKLERLIHKISAIRSTLKFSSEIFSWITLITLFINSSSALFICILCTGKKGRLENASRSFLRLLSKDKIWVFK